MADEQGVSPKEIKTGILLAIGAFIILSTAVYGSYRHTKSRTPQIILPGGVTYLGPSPKENPASSATTQIRTGRIPVPDNATWGTWKGQKYPYSFSYPTSLSLGFFPNDPYDAVTVFWQNTDPSANLLLRVEDLSQNPDTKKYLTKPKRGYVENWWKQFTFTGVDVVAEFTTKIGLKGYRAIYKDSSGPLPYDQVFLEVPGKPELVVWMSQKLLETSVFNRIVDSLTWSK